MDKVINVQSFSEEILNKLYPLLEREFELLKNEIDWQEDGRLTETVEELHRELYSLSYYEKKLVFPSLLDITDKKQMSGANLNTTEIERLTAQKEKHIRQLAEHVENMARNYGLPEKHPIFGLVFLFQNSFCEVKARWRNHLKEISAHKTCPSSKE